MEVFEKIRDSHLEDDIEMQTMLVETQITAEEKARVKYTSQVQELNNELNRILYECEEIEEKNEDILRKQNKYPVPSKKSFQQGDFFHILNAYDYYEAQLNGKIEGQKHVKNFITNEIKKLNLSITKLNKQFEELSSRLPGGYVDPNTPTKVFLKLPVYQPTANKEIEKIMVDLSKARERISQQKEEMEVIAENCSIAQQNIQEISDILRNDTAYSLTKLVEQRDQLTEEVKAKEMELKKVQEELSNEESRINREIRNGSATPKKDKDSTDFNERWLDRRQAILKNSENSQNVAQAETWEAERESLLSRIKNANVELKSIREQTAQEKEAISRRSSVRSRSKLSDDAASVRSDGLSACPSSASRAADCTAQGLRQAIAAELGALESGEHPIETAIEIERAYGEKLDEELKAVERTTLDIEEFTASVFERADGGEDGEDMRNKKQRIAMLKAELRELRERIGK